MTDTENNLFKKVFKLYLRGIKPEEFKTNNLDLDIIVDPYNKFIDLIIGDQGVRLQNNVIQYVKEHNDEPFIDIMDWNNEVTTVNIGWDNYEPTDLDYYNYLMSEL